MAAILWRGLITAAIFGAAPLVLQTPLISAAMD